MIYKEFYSELGKLLYAIANVDGMITLKEKQKLLNIVKNELAPVEQHKDKFQTNDAFFTEIEFDFMDKQITEPEVAFNSFLDFVNNHYTGFDEKMKKACIHVAKELANTYRGTNKKEEKLLKELQKKMNMIGKMKETKVKEAKHLS